MIGGVRKVREEALDVLAPAGPERRDGLVSLGAGHFGGPVEAIQQPASRASLPARHNDPRAADAKKKGLKKCESIV